MGNVKEFRIRLAENRTVYQPGDIIAGDVILKLDSPIETKGIKVKFRGKAYVHWSQRERRGTGEDAHYVTVEYDGKDKLFKHKVYVLGKESEETSLPKGEHVYSFSYQLPDRLPTSYEDDVGYIRYEIKASIDMSEGTDRKAKRVFTVIETLDLNHIENAMKPAAGEDTKYLCCWCCKSGPIKAEFQADRSAYVPGEFITINASLKNKSNSKVKSASVSLMQKVTYHPSDGNSKIRYIDLAGIDKKECPKGKKISWTNERFQLPAIPPTTRGTCQVLEIEYLLLFKGEMRTCAVDLEEYEEVTIGTLPLKNLAMYKDMSVIRPEKTHEDTTNEPALPSAVMEEEISETSIAAAIVPPTATYKRSAGGAINLVAEDDDGETMEKRWFSPQYPFYDWSQTA